MILRLGRWSLEIRIHKGFFRLPADSKLPGTNRFMFAQDIPLRVAPYSRRLVEEEDQPPFKLLGTEDEVARAVSCLSEIGIDRDHDPDEVAEGTVRHIIERLIWSGRLLVDTRHERIEMQGGVYHSAECTDPWTPRIGSYLAQFAFTKKNGRTTLHIGLVPRDRVFVVAIPDELGGARGYRAMTRRLDKFNATGPRHWHTLLVAGTLEPADWNFDFSAYRRRVTAYRDWLTRAWGWNGRDTSTALKTEYFSVYRFLRMHRACAILRSTILQTVQELLRTRGIRARIVTRLRTPEEIDIIIARLSRGDASLEDAYEAIGAM